MFISYTKNKRMYKTDEKHIRYVFWHVASLTAAFSVSHHALAHKM